MTRKGFELKKCEGVDRISELPDEIITHILSFLPLENAVATSILSPRWLDLWKYTPDLIFIKNDVDEPMINVPIAMPIEEQTDLFLVRCLKNSEWVNSVLNSHKALYIRQFTISLHVHEKTYHNVSKWLHFAFSRQVESLNLNLGLSFFVLDLNTLSGIQIGDYRFLKELRLELIHVSGEAIEFLLRNCSLLEVFIMRGNVLSDLVIRGMLKYLEIVPCRRMEKFIKVFAPNLTRLTCGCNYDLLFLENVPNLVEALFIFNASQCTTHHFQNVAAKLESLTIVLRGPKVFSVPQLPKLKKSVLDYLAVNREYLLPVTCLLLASPYLEEFKFEISDLSMYFHSRRRSFMYEAVLEVPEHGRFLHYHLKVFEFAGFCWQAPDHFELVMYIMNNCVALEEIIITPVCLAFARQVIRRLVVLDRSLDQVDAFAEDQHALAMKKSTEQLFAGKVPDHIKLIIQ